MQDFTGELQHLDKLYDSIEARLEEQHQRLERGSPWKSEEIVLTGRLMREVIESNHSVAAVAGDWSSDSLQMAPEVRGRIKELALALQHKGRHLLHLLERNQRVLRRAQEATEGSLGELRQGARFLQSARGYRENRPKFIDTRR